jgi:hypothetical protein
MPDIKSALEKALNDWEPAPAPTPEPAPAKAYFTVTNNVCRTTFDYVRDNPGKTRVEVAKALEAQGYKSGSVSSLLGQMLKQGMMRESAHLLYVTTNEYAPLKSSKALKVAQEKAQQATRKKVVLISKRTGEVIPPASAGIAALPTTREAAPVQINAAWDAETLLNSLSIKQARALYDELRKIFGG